MVALFFKKKNLVCTMNWNHSDVGICHLWNLKLRLSQLSLVRFLNGCTFGWFLFSGLREAPVDDGF